MQCKPSNPGPPAAMLLAAILLCGSAVVHAQDAPGESDDRGSRQSEPIPGQLLMPGREARDNDDRERQCMTVCAQWGQECTYINQGTGGLTRKCRRTCQQTTTECF